MGFVADSDLSVRVAVVMGVDMYGRVRRSLGVVDGTKVK